LVERWSGDMNTNYIAVQIFGVQYWIIFN
jgi:hypothetical protein